MPKTSRISWKPNTIVKTLAIIFSGLGTAVIVAAVFPVVFGVADAQTENKAFTISNNKTAGDGAPIINGSVTGNIIINTNPDRAKKNNKNWFNSADYTLIWHLNKNKGNYPVSVEGRLNDGEMEFRSNFLKKPSSVSGWYSYHGLTISQYREINAVRLTEGYKGTWLQEFMDAQGEVRYQAIWIKE